MEKFFSISFIPKPEVVGPSNQCCRSRYASRAVWINFTKYFILYCLFIVAGIFMSILKVYLSRYLLRKFVNSIASISNGNDAHFLENVYCLIMTCPSRDAIARLAKSRMRNSAISSRLKIPLRTVQKIAKQWKEEGQVQLKSKSGRKKTVNT
uniref:Winged helix-turn-helix domain-containing protein n=1 Tax=Strongyloides stercoralis TaxID=6248 RepID=A0A0K0E5Y5_STRER